MFTLFGFHVLAVTKFKAAAGGLSGLIVAQAEVPVISQPESPIAQWLDLGVTVSALALLGYILRLVIGGGLVSKSLVQEVVNQAVRETLEQTGRDT